MSDFRSLLFVPGARPDRFTRALSAGADAVCLDLEDAVPAARKVEARLAVAAFLAERPVGSTAGVRINALNTSWWEEDLLACVANAAFVMIPKIASAAQVAQVRALAPSCGLWPLVETAEGLRRVWDIAEAPGVEGLLFGAFDYAAEIGCEMEWEPLLFARSMVVAACAGAGVAAMDAPSGDVGGVDLLEESSRRARRLGFSARACIHPAQVEIVNHAFTPSAAEIATARCILAAFEGALGAAAQLDGRLIEEPVAKAARRLLARTGD